MKTKVFLLLAVLMVILSSCSPKPGAFVPFKGTDNYFRLVQTMDGVVTETSCDLIAAIKADIKFFSKKGEEDRGGIIVYENGKYKLLLQSTEEMSSFAFREPVDCYVQMGILDNESAVAMISIGDEDGDDDIVFYSSSNEEIISIKNSTKMVQDKNNPLTVVHSNELIKKWISVRSQLLAKNN